jgi:hypothetical protein
MTDFERIPVLEKEAHEFQIITPPFAHSSSTEKVTPIVECYLIMLQLYPLLHTYIYALSLSGEGKGCVL